MDHKYVGIVEEAGREPWSSGPAGLVTERGADGEAWIKESTCDPR